MQADAHAGSRQCRHWCRTKWPAGLRMIVQKRLADKKIEIELTDGAKELLAEEGFDLVYGARPLKRVIQRDVLNPLASKILSGEIREGSKIIVDKSDRRLVFRAEAQPVGVQ